MQFTVSTKPLTDALNLGIVSQNVSKFYQKSCLAQITATRKTLTINLEASRVLTQVTLKGSGDSDEMATIFVDSLLLKQLVSTFEASVTTLEYTEGGLILHSGKSKFTLPKLLDEADISLSAPGIPSEGTPQKINQDDWKFIKDHQMYAIAMSFITPVYTRVWVGESGDVLVGDFDEGLFTHSQKSKLSNTCLLSDTIINLFNSLPEGATIVSYDSGYVVHVETDGFEYISEFTPQYEEDEGVGMYSAPMILDMMQPNAENSIKLNVEAINKFLSQAALLSTDNEDAIKFALAGNDLSLTDKNVDCKLHVDGTCEPFEIEFKTSVLKSVISNLDEEVVSVTPTKDDEGTIVGIILWTSNMTTVIAGLV